jgi:hypothetical protein
MAVSRPWLLCEICAATRSRREAHQQRPRAPCRPVLPGVSPASSFATRTPIDPLLRLIGWRASRSDRTRPSRPSSRHAATSRPTSALRSCLTSTRTTSAASASCPRRSSVVSNAEWETMDQALPEPRGFLRRHIDLPGVRHRKVTFGPFSDSALAPFRQGHDLMRDGSLVLLPTPGHTPARCRCGRAACRLVRATRDCSQGEHTLGVTAFTTDVDVGTACSLRDRSAAQACTR